MAVKRRIARGTPGLPTDAFGGATVDPTENVKALTEAANIRQDDLRQLTRQLIDVELDSIRSSVKSESRLAKLRAKHQRELDHAESDRLNSIRQVDREEVAKSAATIQTATTALANQTSILAETLRTQVGTVAAAAEARAAAVATAAENRLNQFSADVIKRVSALELSLSEGKGKQTIVDPQIERLSALVEQLSQNQSERRGVARLADPKMDQLSADVAALIRLQTEGAGRKAGMSDAAKMVIAGIGLLATLLVIGGVLVTIVLFLNRGTASPPYIPAPYGTQLPAQGPASVPR